MEKVIKKLTELKKLVDDKQLEIQLHDSKSSHQLQDLINIMTIPYLQKQFVKVLDEYNGGDTGYGSTNEEWLKELSDHTDKRDELFHQFRKAVAEHISYYNQVKEVVNG
jgi:hypothetical protein